MQTEVLLQQLPVIEGSLRSVSELDILEDWGPRGVFAPLYFRPQLFSELKEVLGVVDRFNIALIPFGTFHGFCPLSPPVSSIFLLTQPGSCSLWRGIEVRDRIAYFPAALRVEEAEKLVNAEGFTLSLGLFDRGSLGGNWVLPRGSFLTFTYQHPAERMVGVNAILSDGSLLRSRIVPRSAAGPNLARALMGMGTVRGFVVEVILRLNVLGEERRFRTLGTLTDLLDRLRNLVQKGYAPTAAALYSDPKGEAVLYIRHNLNNSWQERILRRIRETLPLEEMEGGVPHEHQPPRGWGCHRLPWSLLQKSAAQEKRWYLSDPSPEGLLFWHPYDPEIWAKIQGLVEISPSS